MADSSDRPKISCIILAGGKGRRFDHKDKGLIKYDNRPMIEHVIDSIRYQVDDIVISANRNTDIYRRHSDKVYKDDDETFSGPLSGIARCIDECEHDWILVLPCDIPVLPCDLTRRLEASDEDRLVIANAEQRRQLVFLMHRSLKQNLDEFLASGQQRVMAWIEQQNPREVTFDPAAQEFLNINSAEDLAAL